MIVIAFLFSVIGLVGLTFIIVESEIAESWRKWWGNNVRFKLFGVKMSKVVDCHQCTGFWVGLFGTPWLLPWLPPPSVFMIGNILLLPVIAFLSGCAISFLAVVARAVLDWLTLNINIPLDDLEQNDQEKSNPLRN